MIKDKAFHNLKASDLHQKGAATAERLHGLPIYVRGSVTGEAIEISKAHFSKLLKQLALSDTDSVKDTLAAIAAPVISARKGIPLSARLNTTGSSSILVFAPEDLIQTCPELRDINSGVVLTSDGVTPFYYQAKDGGAPNLYKIPSSVVLVSADRSGALPPLAKLTPGQAAYHFLAGYHNGKFVPVYCKGPSPVDPLELSKAFLSWLKDNNNISTFLTNVKAGEKPVTGKDLVELIESTLSSSVPQLAAKGDLEGKYKKFISVKFGELPEELTF